MTGNEKPKLGSVLLAAGDSSRLGRPKQLLEFEGETLLRRATRILTETVYFPVVVVLGAEYETTIAEIDGFAVYSILNKRWDEGISSSIRTGLQRLLDIEPDIDGVVITLCDQPQITVRMLDRFADMYVKTQASVIAAAYEGVSGVPALFSKEVFKDLMALEGDTGARALIRNCRDLATIEMPEAAYDIDTTDDANTIVS